MRYSPGVFCFPVRQSGKLTLQRTSATQRKDGHTLENWFYHTRICRCTRTDGRGGRPRLSRALCSFGAAYVVGEMVSAKGITMGDRKSAELLSLSEAERPAAIQLFGDDPSIMAEAAQKALFYRPQAIDINMGCPAPKSCAAGAALPLCAARKRLRRS